MEYRTLGKTGERVSALGLGGAHAGRPQDPAETTRIIRTAIDNGVTFMDNCWDYQNGQAEVRAVSYTSAFNAPALFAWLHKDALIKRLEAEIDATSSDALSAEQRAKKTREMQAAILTIERQEVALADDDLFALRPDTDVRAFLLCEGPQPEGALG